MGDFVTQFHSLSGNTVGEKKRSLLRLFQTHPNQTLDINPQNHLERLFYVDSLIFYRNFNKLYANYLQNDDITVNKLRNVLWFFRRVLDMPQDFVREVLPQFSYVARQKLITGTAKVMTEHEADAIFDALVDRYGLAHGLRIATHCSKAKLFKITEEYDDSVKLKNRQLNGLYKTCPEIFEKLIQDKQSNVFVEIANKNPDWFVKLVTNGKCEKKLGRRSTKNFLKTKREVVLDKVAFYLSNVLNQKQFVRIMGEDIERIYEQLLSTNPNLSSYGSDWDLLQHCQRNKRYLIHMKAVEKKFGSFRADFVTDSFLELVRDNELREKLAVAKYKETQNEDWWKYYKTKECLVKVTEMLNSTPNPRKRANLARILAANCCNNRDYKEFFLVLELLTNRLKNDQAFLTTFMDYLQWPSRSFDFQECSKSHWKLLIDIVTAPDYEDANLTSYMKTHVDYMIYLREGDLLEELDNMRQPLIDKFGRDYMLDYIKFNASENPAGAAFEREFLMEMTYEADWKVLKRIVDYNKRNSTNPIDLLGINNLKKLLQESCQSYEKHIAMEIFVSLSLNSEFRAKSQELYWSELSVFGSVESITWYMTRDFNKFTCHFDAFLDACFGKNPRLNNKSLWRKIKCYQTLVAKLLQHLHQQNSPKIFKVLAHIVSFEDYVKAFRNLEEHYSGSVNSYDQKFNETEIEKKILLAFRQFVKNAKALKANPQALLSFTSRPFVERVPMVYHAFYNMPEGEALPFLEQIRIGGVSTTKQALFLTCVICERKVVAEELRRNKLTQTVPQALRYFIKNPSDDLFEVVLLRLKKLDQNNSDTTALVSRVSNIPKKYQPRYFERLWNVLTDTNSKSLKERTISSCSSAQLRPEQVALVFKSDFLRRYYWSFTSQFLIANPADPDVKLELFFKHLAQFKQEHWSESDAKRSLSGFIDEFVNDYMKSDTAADILMIKFADMFKATFRDAETLRESTKISLVQLKNKSIEDCAKLLSHLVDDVVDRFSEVCLRILVDIAQEVLAWPQFDFTRVNLCYNLLKFKTSANNAIMVLNLLPKIKPKDTEEKELQMYQWVVSTIQSIPEASVEVYLNLYYKSLD